MVVNNERRAYLFTLCKGFRDRRDKTDKLQAGNGFRFR